MIERLDELKLAPTSQAPTVNQLGEHSQSHWRTVYFTQNNSFNILKNIEDTEMFDRYISLTKFSILYLRRQLGILCILYIGPFLT